MKRLIPILALTVPLALAACNKGPTVEVHNASVAEVAEKAQDAVKMQAGEWVMKTEILDMAMPGIKDPKMAQMMKDALAKQRVTTTTDCVTEEEAARPAARMFAGDSAGNCKYEHFTMAGGKIDAALVCGAQGANDTARHSRMTMVGTFTGSSMDMVSEVGGGGGGGVDAGMSMKMHMSGKRVGPCTAADKKAG